MVAAGLAAVVAAAAAGWIGGRRIQSPAEVASKTAAPTPSLIVAPVEKRSLANEVVVRGSVRYGAPQGAALATSALKKGTDIVTTAPTKGAELREGDIALAASGRPVFVLRGDKPAYRDLGPGASGIDVEQLEKALARLGIDPGPVDGTYDSQTAAAVATMYANAGWAPFGPTEEQTQALRTAQTDDFNATSDLVGQREGLESAQGALATAHERARRAAIANAAAPGVDVAAAAKAEHERLLAVAEVTTRSAALDTAVDAEAVAKVALDEAVAGVPTVPTRVELATVQAAARQATRAVATAKADLAAAQAGLGAVVVPVPDAAAKDAAIEVAAADDDVARAKRAVSLAQSKVDLHEQRAAVKPIDQVASKLGVQVPADEVLFFPTLPLRIDTVKLAAGDPVAGPVMTVTNSRLAVDGALSLDDTRLVKAGAPVTITESELAIKVAGVVSAVASTPGTDGAEAQRFHLEVTPTDAPAALVGTSVVLNITVNSTDGEVLALPVSALSVAADGTSRVQVQAKDKTTTYVTVTPGLAASGLVAVTSASGELKAGDLVVVGSDQSSALLNKGAAVSTAGSAGAATSVPAGSSKPTGAATSVKGG